MLILVVIAILLFAAAIGIVAHVLSPSSDQRAKTLTQISTYGFRRRGGDDESGGRMRERLDNLAARIGSAVGSREGGSMDFNRIRAQLIAAGMYNTSPGKFVGYRVLCTIGLPLLWIWFAVTVHVGPVLMVM